MTDVQADRRTAARRALVKAVLIRRAVRSVRDIYPPGGAERRTAAPVLRALDDAVRRQAHTAYAAGIDQAEIARVVGVSASRISRIVRREQGPMTAHDGDDQVDGAEPGTCRADLLAAVAARRELREQRHARPVRSGTEEWHLLQRSIRAADRTVRAAVTAAHADGMSVRDIAVDVGVTTGIIRRILGYLP